MNPTYDLTLIENTDALKRRYAGLTTQGHVSRLRVDFNVGATYTLSRAWGNVDGENVNSGPIAERHPAVSGIQAGVVEHARTAICRSISGTGPASGCTYGVPRVNGLTLSVLQTLESGVPYGAVGHRRTSTAGRSSRIPGYLTPPHGSVDVTYYYTARDAFRTEGQQRTDLALNYTHRCRRPQRVELFGQLQVLNLFNHFQLCGCGAARCSRTAAPSRQTRIDQTVDVGPAQHLQTFNPFTTTPRARA